MKYFFDTSVLIAAFAEDHRQHEASLDALVRIRKGSGFCGAHSLAEFYSVATRLPGKHRLSADQILLCFADLRERMAIVSLTADEYFEAMKDAAARGISGGLIYDLLLARCAVKAGAEIIYTWNVKHFEQLGPEISWRLRTP